MKRQGKIKGNLTQQYLERQEYWSSGDGQKSLTGTE